MKQAEVQLVNRLGLHARAAARFVHLASSFRSAVTVSKAGVRVDGKSILGLLTLAAPNGTRLTLAADGPDADEALRQLTALIRDRFGEEG